jgi:hypothetical protein
MKRNLIAAGIGLAALTSLAACSNDSKDFKKSAEDFIESKTVESQVNTTFTDAACTEPAKVAKGETFTCTAVDADGTTWDFQLQITADDAYEIVDGGPRS